jgi:tetratricopeptide (TPR) repeat protein
VHYHPLHMHATSPLPCATSVTCATAQEITTSTTDNPARYEALSNIKDTSVEAGDNAREAGNACLLAFAAGEQAYVLLDLHRPAEALAMVRAAYAETHTAIPHEVRGWLRAAEAEMAAAAGEESTCRTALDSAAREISHGAASDDLPYLALNETHLARWRGNCLILFGDPQTADDLNAALAAMDGSFTRAEASLRCDLAAALHVRGEQDEAKRHLKRARELAQITGSVRQRRRIRDLSKRIAKAA